MTRANGPTLHSWLDDGHLLIGEGEDLAKLHEHGRWLRSDKTMVAQDRVDELDQEPEVSR